MQTARDVIDALLRKRPAERVGLNDSPWADTLRKWVDQGYPGNDKGEPVSAVEHFDFDMMSLGGFFDALPIRGYDEVLEETAEWHIKRNGAGAALKWWKSKSGTPEHIDFRMTSRKVWERDYRSHLLEVDRERIPLQQQTEALAKAREQGRWAFFGHWFIWESMRMSLGDVCMYESLILDPEWIHDYNRVHTDFFKAHCKVIFEEAGLPDGIWIYEDLGYRNGLFCSPKVLAELIFPYYAELVDFFHSYGLPVVFHACGGIEEAIPLVVEAGFDALNPMEVKAGCDTLRFAGQYGDRLAFVGGLDARILESGDRDLIRKGVIRLVEGMKDMGVSYVYGSDHSVSTNVDYDDFRYAVEVYRDHMQY